MLFWRGIDHDVDSKLMLELRNIDLDDLLPLEALEIMNEDGKWLFKHIHCSLVDNTLSYKNQVVRKF